MAEDQSPSTDDAAPSSPFSQAHLATRERRDVLQAVLPVVTKARRLDGAHLDASAQLVDDQGGQRLGLHVLSDDQQRALQLWGSGGRRGEEVGSRLGAVWDVTNGFLHCKQHNLPIW